MEIWYAVMCYKTTLGVSWCISLLFFPLDIYKSVAFFVAGDVLFEEYTLEYGRDRLEMHVGAVEQGDRALVVDDLIATGGTLCAAMSLLGK